jgi:hypothetical protein
MPLPPVTSDAVEDWTLERAEAALPRVTEVLQRVRDLADASRLVGTLPGVTPNGHGASAAEPERPAAINPVAEAQLREALATLTDQGIVLRDPYRGLIDFPAHTADGREYHLCWLLGEPRIGWWHWPEAGFAGRTPIEEAPA